MKTLVIALVITVIPAVLATQASAFGDGGTPICSYERKIAMAAGRAGDQDIADDLWLAYWDCLNGK